MSQRVPDERFEGPVEWPDPAPDPACSPVDRHRGPLDDDDDARFLDRDDPRRAEVERRRRSKGP